MDVPSFDLPSCDPVATTAHPRILFPFFDFAAKRLAQRTPFEFPERKTKN